MNIPWEILSKVPISVAKKQQWVEECINHLKKNPDDVMTCISSGDTTILVSRVAENIFSIEDLRSERWALYDETSDVSDSSDACSCTMANLLKKGCSCGGN